MGFNYDIKKLARKLQIRENVAVARFALDLSRRIDMMSPFDTGLFRSNWQARLDGPYSGADLAIVPGGRLDEAIPYCKQANGHIYYFTNKIPYARPLEYGHSMQAPNGMIRVSAAAALQALENAVRSVQ